MIKAYKTSNGLLLEFQGKLWSLSLPWDEFLNRDNLYQGLTDYVRKNAPVGDVSSLDGKQIEAPIGTQEIWAAGVTYLRSRDARKEEAKETGGGDFYDKVYDAPRPEIFFKGNPHRCAGPGKNVRIRRDSSWNVPEPELTLVINSKKRIVGYTIGNDMSSRSIEGENPLYLPQAKTYDGSASLGPCVVITDGPISPETSIALSIKRKDKLMFDDKVSIKQMKRTHQELVEFLCRECSFPSGVYLMTGTCLVPPNSFTLASGDEILITIDSIGTLQNFVE